MFPQIVKDKLGIPRVVESETEGRPWMPSSFIDWLEPRLTKDINILEFGSGNSSLFFARRAYTYLGIEHHILWHRAVHEAMSRAGLTSNTAVEWINPNRTNYASPFPLGNLRFDIIIIDGVNRDDCIYESLEALSPRGVIILDNSDSEAHEGQQWLRDQGFSEKVFSGEYEWATAGEIHSTTIFYRSGNCLGI